MGMTYHQFAKIYGNSLHQRRLLTQGTMYMEFQDYYEPCVEAFGVEFADDLMQTIVDYGWEVYLNTERMSPIEIGMAFERMFDEYFNDNEEFNLIDVERNFNHYIDLVRQ